MFFKLHKEGKIGYKQLTDADLRKGKGNTTHIAIFGDILTYLPDKDYEGTGMFIYNNNVEFLPFCFDRIRRQDGSIDSAKIKSGGRNIVAIPSIIQQTAKDENSELKWYLIWFGLQNEEVVFYLFNNSSEEYEYLNTLINLTKNLVKGRINNGNSNFAELLIYLERYVNQNNIEYISELEVFTQAKDFQVFNKKYKPFDIERANKLFESIGRNGEVVINNFLLNQQKNGQISNYCWYNEVKETGLPYDFHLQTNDQNTIYIDVKSTNFKFEQPMIFSNQEIDFINNTPNYNIYRVYDLSQEIAEPKLKICGNSKNLACKINPHFTTLKNSLETQNVRLQTAKMIIKPENELLNFNNEIILKN